MVVYKPASAPDGPTTTSYPQEVSHTLNGRTVRFIDTPGIVLPGSSSDVGDRRDRDILLRNRGRIDKLKDPLPTGLSNPHLLVIAVSH